MLSPVLGFVLAFLLGPPQSPAAASRIATVLVKGVVRYKPEDVTRLSGLAVGRPATVTDLTAAANRLASTGLFDSVRYSYTTGSAMTVTFDVEEAKWTVPVILDNFVSIPESELVAAIATEVPSFDGTAPTNAGAAEFLTRAIQRVLTARGVPGRVEFNTQADMRASGPPRYLMESAAKGTLTDMYRRKGYWRAVFETRAAAASPCGVTVTLTVSEGVQYAWDRAEWSGNAVHSADVLNKALGMEAGETADASKIDTGLREVRRAYGKVGYILEQATFKPVLDDGSRKAVLGDVYNDDYESTYSREVLSSMQTTGGARARLDTQVDAEKHVVNLTVTFR